MKTSDGLLAKFTWTERECNFTVHHLRETWNTWMAFYPICRDFVWSNCQFLCDFTWNFWSYMNCTWMWIHNIVLMWIVIHWNAEIGFWVWVFRECDFTDPSHTVLAITEKVQKIRIFRIWILFKNWISSLALYSRDLKTTFRIE